MGLTADRVSLRFGANWALREVSISVEPHRFTALVGPNGAGKSSLLRLLSGELKPSAGSVHCDHRPLQQLGVQEQARRRAVMTQSTGMTFDFLVEEVLRMGWVQHKGSPAADRNKALRSVVADCGLGHLFSRKFNTLSGGERQRVQFARALLQIWRPAGDRETRYLLLDEPTASLDLTHELRVLRLARKACQENLGVLAVLHDLNLAARFADHAVLLAGGATAGAGPPAQIFTNERLSHIYQTPVYVEQHERLERLVVHTE